MNAPRVHAAIVSYNSSAELAKCVASITRRAVVVDVHILDNASSSEHSRTLRQLAEHPKVHLTLGASNVGFGAGVNRIISNLMVPEEDYIWVLNPDLIVEKHAPDALLRELHSGSFDIVCPLVTDGTGETVWFAGGDLDWRAVRSPHWWLGADTTGVPQASFPTTFVSGACFMLRKRDWDRIGGFDETLFLYWEDADWSQRALESGLKAGIVPTSVVRHAQGASSGGGESPTFFYYSTRNRVLLSRRYGNGSVRLFWGTGAKETVRILTRPLRNRRGIAVAASAVAGMIAGLRGRSGRR